MIQSAPREILLVTGEIQVTQAVQLALKASGGIVTTNVCHDLQQLASRLADQPAPGVVVDIDANPIQSIRQLEPIISTYPQSRFVLLSRDHRQELILEAMQAGARHLLKKDAITTELSGILDRLVFNGSGAEAGAAVSVFSASGGCGATFIATNLAAELGTIGEDESLLVDLDWAYGGVSSYLGLQGSLGISEVLAMSDLTDAGLIKSGATRHSKHLHVLGASNRLGLEAPSFGNLPMAVQGCRKAYRWSVFDAPRLPRSATVAMAQASQVSLIVMQLAVKDVHVARQIGKTLLGHGVPSSRILTVINRCRRHRRMLSIDECRHSLQHERYAVISNDFDTAMPAMNYGKTLIQAAPRSSLRKEMCQLAKVVASLAAERKQVAA